jgi:hypothetical protein
MSSREKKEESSSALVVLFFSLNEPEGPRSLQINFIKAETGKYNSAAANKQIKKRKKKQSKRGLLEQSFGASCMQA